MTSLRTDHEGVDSLTQGVAQYQALGVPPAKLVTIFAWFGMDVQCTNTSGACALEYPHCYAKGTGDGHDCQPGYSTIVHDLLPRSAHPSGSTGWGPLGVVQRDQFGLPYFDYAGNMSKRHRVRFSDRNSTAVRSKWARDASLGGVGIWTADALDTVRVPPVHELEEEDLPHLQRVLNWADVVLAQAVQDAKAGKVDFRVEKAGIVHAGVGKTSFTQGALVENVNTFVDAIMKAKPSGLVIFHLASLMSAPSPGRPWSRKKLSRWPPASTSVLESAILSIRP